MLPLLTAILAVSAAAGPSSFRDWVRAGAVEEIVVDARKAVEVAELAAASDAIAEVIVLSERSYLADGDQIWTEYRVEVINALKSSQPMPSGTALNVRRRGGTAPVDGRTVRSMENRFPGFSTGGMYVLFLRKTDGRDVFTVVGGPYGAYAIANGTVTLTIALSEFRESVSRQPQARRQ